MKKLLIGILFLVLGVGLTASIFIFGDDFGLNDTKDKLIACLVGLLFFIFLFILPAIYYALWSTWSKNYSFNKDLNPKIDEDNFKNDSVNWISLLKKQIQLSRSGFFRKDKPCFILLGNNDAIEKIFPEFKNQQWIETIDAFWINAQDNLATVELKNIRGKVRSPADMCIYFCTKDEFFEAKQDLQYLMLGLGWVLPVSIICVDANQSQSQCASISNLSPSKSSSVIIDAFINKLSLEGEVQIEGEVQHNFFAKSACWIDENKNIFKNKIERLNEDFKGIKNQVSLIFAGVKSTYDANLSHQIFESIDVTKSFKRKKRIKKTFGSFFLFLINFALILLVCGLVTSFLLKSSEINTIEKLTKNVNSVTTKYEAHKKILPLKEELQKIDGKTNSWLFNVRNALYPGYQERILQSAYTSYKKLLNVLLLDDLKKNLEEKMVQTNPNEYIDNAEEIVVNPAEKYNQLKTYLMLTKNSDKSESDFLSNNLNEQIKALDNQVRHSSVADLISFYTSKLPSRSELALIADSKVIDKTRKILNEEAESDVKMARYEKIIKDAQKKFPELSLSDLIGNDYRRIWRSSTNLSSVYTKNAWDKVLKKEFEKASKNQGDSFDWVLMDNINEDVDQISVDELNKIYFNDYLTAWYKLLNGISWVKSDDLQSAIEQLNVYSDPSQSPLVDLLREIEKNGKVDEVSSSLKLGGAMEQVKTLSRRRLNHYTGSTTRRVLASQSGYINEQGEKLASDFASTNGLVYTNLSNVMQLIDPNIDPKSDLSLQRYLEKIAVVKDKLLQITLSADSEGLAKKALQDMLLGKNNEFIDSQNYASMIKNGLGSTFQHFSESVFTSPILYSINAIATPAKYGINESWSKNVALPWKEDMEGRYPFADSDNTISIRMLENYLRPDQGLIDSFIRDHLGGVLQKQGKIWVQSPGEHLLNISPEFLNSVNSLSKLSWGLFAQGDRGYEFQMKPVPSAGLVYTELVVEGKSIKYFNQSPQWTTLKWPGEFLKSGAKIIWEIEDSEVRKNLEFDGGWGFVQLLKTAKIQKIDNSNYMVSFPLKDGLFADFLLRQNSGGSPIDLFDFKNFKLPLYVFKYGKAE